MTNSKSCWFATLIEATEYKCEAPEECPVNGWKTWGTGSESGAIPCEVFATWEKNRKLQRKLDGILPAKFRELGFSNFDSERSKMTKQAYNVAQKYYSKRAYKKGANLLFLGGYGTGKTHLAVALLHNAIMQGHTAGFVTASTMNRGGFDEIEQRFEAMKDADLVVIDDLATELENKLIANHMFSLINYRYQTEKGLVITSNMSLKELGEAVGKRILDRITERSAVIYITDVESYRKNKRKEYLEWMEGE